MKLLLKFIGYMAVIGAVLSNPVSHIVVQAAPSSTAATAPKPPGTITWKYDKMTTTGQGLRLEGNPASGTSPEMSVFASLIEADRPAGTLTEIRARQSVHFKMNRVAGGSTPVSIDVRSNEATANIVKGTLVLTGNVDGQYTIGKGRPNKLRGSQATLTFANQNLKVDVEGGTEDVRLELPPEEPAAKPVKPPVTPAVPKNPVTGVPQATLGTVIITAQRATLNAVLKAGNTQNEGTARFIGNARAVSTDGPTKLDLTASEFTLTRSDKGTIDTLKTVGRARLKIDFPPPVARPGTQVLPTNQPANNQPQGGGQNTVNAVTSRTQIGRPTHVEAEADALTVTRPANEMVLAGNVSGFYRLSPVPPNEGQPQDLPFTQHHRVILRFDEQEGLQVQGMGTPGNPGVIETPGFDFKFGD